MSARHGSWALELLGVLGLCGCGEDPITIDEAMTFVIGDTETLDCGRPDHSASAADRAASQRCIDDALTAGTAFAARWLTYGIDSEVGVGLVSLGPYGPAYYVNFDLGPCRGGCPGGDVVYGRSLCDLEVGTDCDARTICFDANYSDPIEFE